MQQSQYAYGITDRHSDTSKKNPTPLHGITRDTIVARVANPQRVKKRLGSYVIPSTLLTRNFSAQREHGQYGFGWLDLDETAITKQQLVDVLRTILPGYGWYLYSTASADGVSKFKWRVLWFYSQLIETGAMWSRYQRFINDLVAGHGITPDRVNERSAQLCFLPNAPGQYYDHHIEPGIDVDPVVWMPYLPAEQTRVSVDRDLLAEENPNFDKLLDEVTVLDEDHSTGILIECPWHEEHSNDDNTALLIPPGDTNGNRGGFRCLHHSHEHKNIGHVYDAYQLQPKTDFASMFGDSPPPIPAAALPAAAGPVVAAIDDEELSVRIAEMESADDVADVIPYVCARDEVVRGRFIDAIAVSVGVSKRDVRGMIKDHERQTKLERQKQIVESYKANGSPLQDLDLIRQDGTVNPHGFAVIHGNKTLFASMLPDRMGFERVNVRKLQDFKERCEPMTPHVGPDEKPVNRGEAWYKNFSSDQSFDGLTFMPGKPLVVGTELGYHRRQLNTYTAPVIDPVGNIAGIQVFLNHIREWLCSGDDGQFDYFMSYMAHMMQKPEVKPCTGILLSGGIGIGKSAVLAAFGEILGGMYTRVDGPGSLTVKFNDHLASRLLIFNDEFEETNSARLRAMITSLDFKREGKGEPVITLPCFSRFVMGTNRKVPVDTSDGERRLLWCDCSETMPGAPTSIKRVEFLTPLFAEMRAEGFHSALYAFLLDYDISRWQPELIPETKSKADALRDGDAVASWWSECLSQGQLFSSRGMEDDSAVIVPGKMEPVARVITSLNEWCKTYGVAVPGRRGRREKFEKLGFGTDGQIAGIGKCYRMPP